MRCSIAVILSAGVFLLHHSAGLPVFDVENNMVYNPMDEGDEFRAQNDEAVYDNNVLSDEEIALEAGL